MHTRVCSRLRLLAHYADVGVNTKHWNSETPSWCLLPEWKNKSWHFHDPGSRKLGLTHTPECQSCYGKRQKSKEHQCIDFALPCLSSEFAQLYRHLLSRIFFSLSYTLHTQPSQPRSHPASGQPSQGELQPYSWKIPPRFCTKTLQSRHIPVVSFR